MSSVGVARIAAWMLGVLCLVASPVSACISTHPTNLPWLGNWEDTNLYYLRAGTATSGPFLGTEAGASPTSYADPALGAPGGIQSLVGSYTSTGRSSVTFALTNPLPSNLYLNLSKPIIGKLYYASTITSAQSSNARGDAAQVRFEVFSGTRRVAGFEHLFTAQAVRNPWAALNFCLRAESRLLEAGQPLSIKITRITGFADLQIGVGGSQQSYVEVHTFNTDPLQGALYVEGKNLVRLPSAPGSDPGGDLAAVALLPLAALAPRRARRALLPAALLLAAGLSGCLGGDKPAGGAAPGESTRPSVSVTYEPVPSRGPGGEGKDPGNASKVGRVEGTVVNPLGIPVDRAHVSVLETSLFADTNAKGEFVLANVTPGTYVFRVDKTGFVSFQDNVTVLAGVVTKATFTLTYPATKQADDKPHYHDDWDGATEKVVWTKTLTPEWRYTAPGADKATLAAPPPGGVPREAAPDPFRTQNCPSFGTCTYILELADNTYIYPGTSLVELNLQWNKAAAGAPQEMSLSFTTPTNTSSANRLVARGPNDPFRVAIFPTEADPGHLKFTDWSFTLRLPTFNDDHPFGHAGYAGTSITFTLKIYKGVVPYERAHADFWQGATEIDVVKGATYTNTCYNCDFPDYTRGVWSVGAGKFVPPETSELRGTLKWSGVLVPSGPLSSVWGLAYRPANMPLRESSVATLPRVEVTRSGADFIDFKIVPKAGEPDQYYQKASRWRFLLDDGDKPTAGANSGYQGVFTLTVTAYKAA